MASQSEWDRAALVLLAAALVVAAGALTRRREVTVIPPPRMVGLLYVDGQVRRELSPGRYAWIDPLKRRRVVKISTAELPVDLPEGTVMSNDRYSCRLGLSPVVTVTHARAFVESQPAAERHAALHPSVAAAALEVVAARTPTEVMADARSVAEQVQWEALSSLREAPDP